MRPRTGSTPRLVTIMIDHTPPTADGAAMYYRVLFPNHGPWRIERVRLPKAGYAHVVGHVSRDGRAQALSRELWDERQRMRATSAEWAERIREIHLEDSIVGDLRVGVCLDCPWIEWGDWAWTRFEPGRDYRSHHRRCLIGERQEPSTRNMRLTMRAADLGLGEWGVWFDKLNPQHVRPASYALMGMSNYWGGLTHTLWERREKLRASEPPRKPGEHRGACFELYDGEINRSDGAGFVDLYRAWALCLDCMWLKFLGDVHDHPGWKDEGQALALEHEANPMASS